MTEKCYLKCKRKRRDFCEKFTVHGVTLSDKVRGCVIGKTLNVELLFIREITATMVRSLGQNDPRDIATWLLLVTTT